MLRAVAWVQQSHPFYNTSSGLNHFIVFPLDHGRCHALAGLTADKIPNVFAIQQTGDIQLKDFETRSWHCYRPGRDVLIPTETEETLTLASIVKPFDRERSISVLYRFAEGGRGDYGALRTRLQEQAKADYIPGSVSGVRLRALCCCASGLGAQSFLSLRWLQAACCLLPAVAAVCCNSSSLHRTQPSVQVLPVRLGLLSC